MKSPRQKGFALIAVIGILLILSALIGYTLMVFQSAYNFVNARIDYHQIQNVAHDTMILFRTHVAQKGQCPESIAGFRDRIEPDIELDWTCVNDSQTIQLNLQASKKLTYPPFQVVSESYELSSFHGSRQN